MSMNVTYLELSLWFKVLYRLVLWQVLVASLFVRLFLGTKYSNTSVGVISKSHRRDQAGLNEWEEESTAFSPPIHYHILQITIGIGMGSVWYKDIVGSLYPKSHLFHILILIPIYPIIHTLPLKEIEWEYGWGWQGLLCVLWPNPCPGRDTHSRVPRPTSTWLLNISKDKIPQLLGSLCHHSVTSKVPYI